MYTDKLLGTILGSIGSRIVPSSVCILTYLFIYNGGFLYV